VQFPPTAPRRLGGPTFLAMLDRLAPEHKTIPFNLAQRALVSSTAVLSDRGAKEERKVTGWAAQLNR